MDRSIRIRHALTDVAGHDDSYEVTLHYLSAAQLDEMAVKGA